MRRLNIVRMRPWILALVLLMPTVFLASCGGDDPAAPADANHAPAVPVIDTAAGGPADGAADVPLSQQLHWTCSDSDNDPLTYTVHFGTEARPPVVSQDQAASSYTPSGLANGTTYYWQVTASDDGNKATNSPIWSFTTLAAGAENVSTPGVPTGSATGQIGAPSAYATTAGASSEGHPLEYRFDWGDGTSSDWAAVLVASHAWSAAGAYDVKSQARCQDHPAVESAWSSPPLVVVISGPETVSAPDAPAGPATGETTQYGLRYDLSGAVSSLGHSLEYQFDWGDGQTATWSVNAFGAHSWPDAGTYQVSGRARCQDHPAVESAWSTATTVTISPPAETVPQPSVVNPPTNGGTGDLLEFQVSVGNTNLGHATEVQLDWGDGTFSAWGPRSGVYFTASHAWTAEGTYQIKAQARCLDHPGILSQWSAVESLEIVGAESVTPPGLSQSGERTYNLGSYVWLIAAGAESNKGHSLEVQYDWGNGTMSDWSVGTGGTLPTDTEGDFVVRAHARCADHPDIISDWGPTLLAHVVDLETINRPNLSSPGTGTVGVPVVFTVSGAVSSHGHALEYQLWWGLDSSMVVNPEGWTTPDNLSLTFDAANAGAYVVQVQARCIDHPDVESVRSLYHYVFVTE